MFSAGVGKWEVQSHVTTIYGMIGIGKCIKHVIMGRADCILKNLINRKTDCAKQIGIKHMSYDGDPV